MQVVERLKGRGELMKKEVKGGFVSVECERLREVFKISFCESVKKFTKCR